MVDVIGKLPDAWWKKANDAAKWKPKYECMQEVLELICGDEKGKKPIPLTIKDHKKAKDFMKIFCNWVQNENHVFTRIFMLKCLPTFIRSFDKKIIEKHQTQIFESIVTKQWADKKKDFVPLANPCLLELISKTSMSLKADEQKDLLMAAFKHRGVEVRRNVVDFISKLSHYPKQKKNLEGLLSDKNMPEILKKLAGGDKDKQVKVLGCKCLHAINEAKFGKKFMKGFEPVWDALSQEKRAKKNIEEAKKLYTGEKTHYSAIVPTGGADDDEKKDDKKKKKGKKGKKKKGKKKGGGGAAPPSAAPVAAAPAAAAPGGGGDADDPNIKIEGGKKYRRVVKTVKKTRQKAAAADAGFKKGVGGVMTPSIPKKGTKKVPKKYSDGQEIDRKLLPDNKKFLDLGTKYKLPNKAAALKKLAVYVKGLEDDLQKTSKILDRCKVMAEIQKAILKGTPKWDKIYDGIISLAAEVMGWEGTDARNPTLAKTFLNLISKAMAGASGVHKGDTGLFTVFLKWALQRLEETKFNKAATECLINTCYQYTPKVVFSAIETLLLEPEDEKKDPFKNDKKWGPIIKFASVAIKEFGVTSIFPLRLIKLIHTKIPKARDAKAKAGCYDVLCELYKQLGKPWKPVLEGPLSKQIKKALGKKFDKIKDPGVYTQIRCTKKEKPPPPPGGEMEEYEEEVEEWIEIVPDAPAVVDKPADDNPPAAAPVVEEKKVDEPKEKTPTPPPKEKSPTPPPPPPPPGPLKSDKEKKSKRLKKAGAVLKTWDGTKPLHKAVVKAYDMMFNGKDKKAKIYDDSCDDGIIKPCKDIDTFKTRCMEKKSQLKLLKPIVAVFSNWFEAVGQTELYTDYIYNSMDLICYWANNAYHNNPQPNFGKVFIELVNNICDWMLDNVLGFHDIEGKMLLTVLIEKGYDKKNMTSMVDDLCSKLEVLIHPSVCYKVYLTTVEKTKTNLVKMSALKQLKKCIIDYGLVQCTGKYGKPKSNPYKYDAQNFCKDYIKIYFKLGSKNKQIKEIGAEILMYIYEVMGDKAFWKAVKVKGSEKSDIEKIVEDAEKFGKGKFRSPDKDTIYILRKKEKKRKAAEKARKAAGGGGGGPGGIDGGDDGGLGGAVPLAPVGPLPGLKTAGFQPIQFTPQQLLALKYGPSPHSWQMNNFRHYVNRLPPAFCMDWDEFEQKKTTINTSPTAPYIKIGDVRIDVETGKQYHEIVDDQGKISIFASQGPGKVGGTGVDDQKGGGGDDQKQAPSNIEQDFLNQTAKDDQIMSDILGLEADNSSYFDPTNDGSSWLALYDVNGFDETDRQIQLIEMGNIYGVKTLQTWLHTGKNVSIIETNVSKLLLVLLPWLKKLINTETLLSDTSRYEQTYQILQLLKFCSKFRTLKTLNKTELNTFYSILLSSITYDNISALFGNHYKRILGEINDILIKSIHNTQSLDTFCILISLLSECDPTNDSLSVKLYSEACCKLIYKILKKYDRTLCQYPTNVHLIYIEIIKFFSKISFETWQMAEVNRRFPLKIIQMIIARIVYYLGNTSAQQLNCAIQKLQESRNQNNKNNTSNIDAAIHQRDAYAKKLILNFISSCENRRLQAKNQSGVKYYKNYSNNVNDNQKPLNIKQQQSSSINNNMGVGSSTNDYKPQSSLQKVNELNAAANMYAKENKIDLHFALWVGMTGRNRADYTHNI